MPSFRAIFSRHLFALISTFLCYFSCASACRADIASWNPDTQGGFIVSLCRDTIGHTWIGTEGNGVWRCNPAAIPGKQYTHFTQKDGLGDDNAYALVCDKAGRVWDGTLNHGVSVFNGKAWRTYSPQDGPLGSRVFALAVNPKDGGVWGATEAGLFRYVNFHWTYFTRADGLPSDQANALAFAPDGTLYVGTQCDGIAIGSPVDGYHAWRIVPGPRQLPNAATGSGLPGALINCLLVVRDGTVYAGTTCGLAASGDGGRTWHFRRGADWKDKQAGLAVPVVPSPRPFAGEVLREDDVTCLAEDGDRSLWVGYRQKGVELFYRDPKHPLMPDTTDTLQGEDVACLLADGAAVWVGRYGGGLTLGYGEPAVAALPARKMPVPPLPVPAPPPALAQLNALLKTVCAVVPDKDELAPKVMALPDDWKTEGDWLGRYGRYWASLNAICSPNDYYWGAGWQNVNYFAQAGPHRAVGDSLRYWVQWLYTQDPRVLELPPTYLDSRVKKGLTTPDNNRREAEQDDHGEVYVQPAEGPNVYQTLSVPAGLFVLSLYDMNYNGHQDDNRFRDYRVSVRAHAGADFSDIGSFNAQPELAHGRIQSFWGGVWKRFLVRGPVALTVEVNRSHSWNTMLPGIMLDLVDEAPPPYFGTVDQWEEQQAHQEEQRQQAQNQGSTALFQPAATEQAAADHLLDTLEKAQFMNSRWWSTHSQQFYTPLLRWHIHVAGHIPKAQQDAVEKHLATCYYQLEQYKQWEEEQKRIGLTPARDVEKALRWDGLSSSSGLGYAMITEPKRTHRDAVK